MTEHEPVEAHLDQADIEAEAIRLMQGCGELVVASTMAINSAITEARQSGLVSHDDLEAHIRGLWSDRAIPRVTMKPLRSGMNMLSIIDPTQVDDVVFETDLAEYDPSLGGSIRTICDPSKFPYGSENTPVEYRSLVGFINGQAEPNRMQPEAFSQPGVDELRGLHDELSEAVATHHADAS